MATITVDMLDFTRRLREAGFNEKQVETVVRVLSDAQSSLVTQEHFDNELTQLEQRMTIKLGTLMVVSVGAVAALVKLL